MTRLGASRRHVRVLATVMAVAAALLWWRAGTLSPTYDEFVDDAIVDCYVATRNPLSCNFDITQARFPFYLHAIVRTWVPGAEDRMVDLAVSGVAALALLAATWTFARRLAGPRVALAAAAVMALSAPFLAMGRMTLTHSNVLFALVTLLAVMAGDAWLRSRSREALFASAALFGLSVGTNLLGSLTVILFAFLFLPDVRARFRLKDAAAFCGIAFVAFIVSSPIYLAIGNGEEALRGIVEVEESTATYNYLGLGVNKAPVWYSPVLFAVKFTPWWTAFAVAGALLAFRRRADATRRTLLACGAFTLFYLIDKSALFRYDAPHHQAHLLPFACILAGYAVDRLLASSDAHVRRAAIAVAALGFLTQAVGVAAFFPNFLFYGAQYGERFVGEFYGPAAVHCQGLDPVNREARRLIDEGADVRATTRLCWKFPHRGAPVVSTAASDETRTDEMYVISPWNDGRFDASTYGVGLGGQRLALETECTPVAEAPFPHLESAYTLFRCERSAFTAALPRLIAPPDDN